MLQIKRRNWLKKKSHYKKRIMEILCLKIFFKLNKNGEEGNKRNKLIKKLKLRIWKTKTQKKNE